MVGLVEVDTSISHMFSFKSALPSLQTKIIKRIGVNNLYVLRDGDTKTFPIDKDCSGLNYRGNFQIASNNVLYGKT